MARKCVFVCMCTYIYNFYIKVSPALKNVSVGVPEETVCVAAALQKWLPLCDCLGQLLYKNGCCCMIAFARSPMVPAGDVSRNQVTTPKGAHPSPLSISEMTIRVT